MSLPLRAPARAGSEQDEQAREIVRTMDFCYECATCGIVEDLGHGRRWIETVDLTNGASTIHGPYCDRCKAISLELGPPRA